MDPRREDQVFEIGDRTVAQMESQPFLDDDAETVATSPGRAPISMTVATELPEETNDLARLEQKVDALTTLVLSLNRRLESIDAVVARALSR